MTCALLLEKQSLRGDCSRRGTQGHLDTHNRVTLFVMDRAGNIGSVPGELNIYDTAGTCGEIENPAGDVFVPEADGLDVGAIR